MDRDSIGSSRILVIDEDPAAVALVKEVLMRAGCASVEATGEPAAALALLRLLEPHVVLLDPRTPEIDGFATLDLLNDEARRIGCSIILLTDDISHELQTEALRRGASDFVTKPFTAAVLVARLAGAAEQRALQRRLRDHDELKRSLARSETERRSRADALAQLAHELRTPLSAVCGFSEVMRRERFGVLAQRYLDYAEDIHGTALHALEVINDFLEMAKAKPGRLPLSMAEIAGSWRRAAPGPAGAIEISRPSRATAGQ